MPKYKIVWSEFASWNLDQIFTYILSKSMSLPLAKRYVLNLILRIEQLENFPLSGKKELLLEDLGDNFRYIVYKDYKIIYFIKEDTVYVTDIFHCKLSPAKIKARNFQ